MSKVFPFIFTITNKQFGLEGQSEYEGLGESKTCCYSFDQNGYLCESETLEVKLLVVCPHFLNL